MGPVSGICLRGSSASQCQELSRRRFSGDPPPRCPPQRPKGGIFFVPLVCLASSSSYCSDGKRVVLQEKVEECYNLMLESAGTAMIDLKRKHSSTAFDCSTSPPSPSAVIGSCFSCESSCDSWAMWPPSSPEAAPPSKRLNGGMSKFYIDEGVEEEGVDSILL